MLKSKRIRTFESSIEKLSRILAKKWDIKVVFGAKVPVTTGKVIYLPNVPNDASKEFLTVMQGHLDHETAHVIFTDFGVFQKIDRKKDKKLYLLTNGIEDCRIEKEYCDIWRGAYSNLKKSLEWALIKMVEVEHRPVPNSPGKFVKTNRWERLNGISRLIYLTAVFPQFDFDEDHWFVRDYVDSETMAGIRKVLPLIKEGMARGGTTTQAYEAAKKILEIWHKDAVESKPVEKPQPKPQPSKPQESSSGDTPTPEPPSLDELQTAEPPPEIPEPLPLEDSVEQYESITSKGQMIKEEVEKANSRNPPKYAVYTTAGDVVEKVGEGSRSAYKSFVSSTSSMMQVIKKKMTRSLLSTATSNWETGKSRGRLDSRAAFKVALGTSNNVFKEKITGVGYDTSVLLMVDHSGSMLGEKLILASQTAIVMGEVLNSIGIPFSVVGFSTARLDPSVQRRSKASPTELDIYTRWGDLWIGVYKDFDENWHTVNHRLSSMPRNGHNNTYDGESLRWGAKQLLNRPEKRKILFWLNDGEPSPAAGDNHPAHIAYTAESAKAVESLVELIAVGIFSKNVSRYYSNYVIVNHLDELPKLCINELDALLRKTKGASHGRK